jgi:hypothetical protein
MLDGIALTAGLVLYQFGLEQTKRRLVSLT